MANWLLQILIISSLHLISPSSQKETSFVYEDFLDKEDLYLDASAKVVSGGSLQLTNTSKYQIGHAFYDKPLELTSSFSTHFVCVLVKKPKIEGGHGIAFLVSPSMDFSHAQPTRYLGVFDASTIKSPSSHVLAVELDTIWNPEFNDTKKNHVGIDVNSPISLGVAPASYYSDVEKKSESMDLLSGKPIQVWVDYEDTKLSVWIAPIDVKKPSRPLLSHPINLEKIFPNRSSKLYVGFAASTGNAVSDQYIMGWSFSTDRGSLPRLDLSKIAELPYPIGTDKKLLALFIIMFGCLAIVVSAILA